MIAHILLKTAFLAALTTTVALASETDSLAPHFLRFPSAPLTKVGVMPDIAVDGTLCPSDEAKNATLFRDFLHRSIADVDRRRESGRYPHTLARVTDAMTKWAAIYHRTSDSYVLELVPDFDAGLRYDPLKIAIECSHIYIGDRQEAEALGLYAGRSGTGIFYSPRLGLYTTRVGSKKSA